MFRQRAHCDPIAHHALTSSKLHVQTHLDHQRHTGRGESTVARALCAQLPQSVHIEGDRLQEFIISGTVPPGGAPPDEENRQIHLNVRNQCLLASSYLEAGFTPVIDYILTSRSRLDEYRRHLGGCALYLVTLDPGVDVSLQRDQQRAEKTIGARWSHLRDEIAAELSGVGLWVDSGAMSVEQTVAKIPAESQTARI
jgi:hypothetical protein